MQILLQKRSQNKDSFPGKFDTSSAGHIQAGDEPLESALRELKEELGISATPEQLHFAGTFPISFTKEFHSSSVMPFSSFAEIGITGCPVFSSRISGWISG